MAKSRERKEAHRKFGYVGGGGAADRGYDGAMDDDARRVMAVPAGWGAYVPLVVGVIVMAVYWLKLIFSY
ncbi:MAG: hypothetical protein KF744_09255 [Taibaiella sp.]|nr:hypothetical protein [Taibaiella sp.]